MEGVRTQGFVELIDLLRNGYAGGDLDAVAGHHRVVRRFSDRERLLLDVVRLHILCGYRNAAALTEARNQLALLSRGVESTGLGFVALTRDKRIAMATGAARRWLCAYFGWKASSRRLPATLEAWTEQHRVDRRPGDPGPSPAAPFRVDQDDRTLTVRLFGEAGEEALVLKETRRRFDTAPLEAHGLTRREAEVLGWVVEGKTNPEIALILELSAPTIHHHLEKIYRKLGVETRTAAARAARELTEAYS